MGRYLDMLKISEKGEGENLINLINPPAPSFLGFLGTPPPTFEKNRGVESVEAEADNVARFRWLIHFTDRDPVTVSFSPEVTHAEALASYPDAVAAEPCEPPPPTLEPMTAVAEEQILAWLALIEETDLATIADVIERCQRDAEARRYFVERAAAESPKSDDDDRRTCQQCANLIGRRCQAAKRSEIAASPTYEPIRDIPRRCEGYAPGAGDPDKRPGRKRWPELIKKGAE